MFTWNDKNIRWFENSANQTDFHKKIANEILPFIDKNSSLLSLGSGLGYLERELSPYFEKEVLVDNNEKAIDFLRNNQLKNQNIVNADSDKIKDKSDYLLLSFYSRMHEKDNLDHYLELVNKKIFYLVNERHTDMNSLFSYLINKKVNFVIKSLRLNFNQVLEKNEIDDFINEYYSILDKGRSNKILNQFEELENEKVLFRNKKKIILLIINGERK